MHDQLIRILSTDILRMRALQAVRSVELPDGWIGAGFVRDAVWDHFHGFDPRPPIGDVDVVWFDSAQGSDDQNIENRLAALEPGFTWSVKNQAMMHLHNGDAPYASVSDAMRHWPETATAVALRMTQCGELEIIAPLGLDDLFALELRPTENFISQKRDIYLDRIQAKNWLSRYPKLIVK